MKRDEWQKSKRRWWGYPEARSKLAEVCWRAMNEGTQFIRRDDGEELVMMTRKEFEALGGKVVKPSLVEALLYCPKVPGFKIERDRTDIVGFGSPLIFEEE